MKKMGFTLVELIAVLVLLAIILAITTPTIFGLIENSRRNAFKSDVKSIIQAIDLRKSERPALNPVIVTENNITDLLEKPSDNYSNIEVTLGNDNTTRIVVEGKNKWEGLSACGTNNNIVVGSLEDCGLVNPIYTNAEIDTKIAAGYIPIANASELNNIRFGEAHTFGSGTRWEKTYTGGLDKKYIQVKNIDLGVGEWNIGEGWLPLGTRIYNCDFTPLEGVPFSGIYDGGGYKISNLYINRTITTNPVALFSSSSGSFYNMILENVNVTGGDTVNAMPTAALVGQATGTDIYMDNIKISGNITTVGNSAGKASAFVGQVGSVNKISITNSQYQGNIASGYNQAGGFIGQIRKYNEILIENSSIKGDVISTYNKTGGFIGEAIYDNYNNTVGDRDDIAYTPDAITYSKSVTIKNSSFQGDVISQYNTTAGLIGEIRYADALTIDGSYAEGDIISDYNKTGGLVGELSYIKEILLNDTHHEGDIISTYNKTGGLIGEVWYYDNLTINNSYNTGNIISDYNKTGGLVGEITRYAESNAGQNLVQSESVTIKNSYASGNIKSTYNKTGGIIGSLSEVDNVLLDNVDYNGKVQGAYTKVAGLIGAVIDIRNLNIKNSNVTGTILGYEGSLGGLIGRIDYVDSTVLEDDTFEGEVNLTEDQDSSSVLYLLNRVGGLVGGIGADSGWPGKPDSYSASVSIKGCDVKADLYAIGSRIGGLVGGADVTYNISDIYSVNIQNSSYEGNIIVDNTTYLRSSNGSFSNYESYYVLAGGLVGSVTNLNVSNSYSSGNIKATINAAAPVCTRAILTNHVIGGIVGRVVNGANISNTYSAMRISALTDNKPISTDASNYIKGFAGDYSKVTVQNSYYDSTISGYDDTLASPKSTIEMVNGNPSVDIYHGWDSNIWNFGSATEYPKLY